MSIDTLYLRTVLQPGTSTTHLNENDTQKHHARGLDDNMISESITGQS